ncbi:MAG TPA: DUF5666 domain-containing protein [Anaerolineaceae bacterium]|nr:DUF5666 domain-containing protein [Anaerolineaceae bacterium]
MTEDRFDLIFEECLRQIRRGIPLDQVLKAYPEYETRLRPLLETAALAIAINLQKTVPVKAQAKSKSNFLEALFNPSHRAPWYSPAVLQRSARSMAVVLIILTAGLVCTGIASAQALPGDSLYPLKITAERTRLLITNDPVQRLQLQNEFDQERTDEVEALFSRNRHTAVAFAGFLTRSSSGGWLVNHVPIILLEVTSRKVTFQEGDYVDVQGMALPDGTVMVEWIRFRMSQFNGRIESISGTEWLVSGIHIQVNADTQLNGDPKVGNLVGIIAAQRANQVLVAHSITVKTVWQDLWDRVPINRNATEASTSEPEIQRSASTESMPAEGDENPQPGSTEEHQVENTTSPSDTPEVETEPTRKPAGTEESEPARNTRTPQPDDEHERIPKPNPTTTPEPGQGQQSTSTPDREEEHSSKSPTPQYSPTPFPSPSQKPDSEH